MARIKQKTNIEEILDIPDLMDIQKKSYKEFLMYETPADKRKNQGLQDVFGSVFPISDYNGIYTLQFVGYEFGKPKHEVEEAIERGESFSSPLKGIFRLAINEKNEKTGQMDLKEAPEQAVHLCDIPLMTDRGTFVINGAERVIVSQLHRSPGVSFEEEEESEGLMGIPMYIGRIVPYRGTWLEFEYDANDITHAKLDRKKKIYATTLLRALGFGRTEDILSIFFKSEETESDSRDLTKKILFKDVIDKSTGEIIAESGALITKEMASKIRDLNIKKVTTIIWDEDNPYINIIKTIKKDSIKSEQEAQVEIYKKMRPGEPATLTGAKTLFKNLFFDHRRYNLGQVGRYKINKTVRAIIDAEKEQKNFDIKEIMENVSSIVEGRKNKNGKKIEAILDDISTEKVLTEFDLVFAIAQFYKVNSGRMEKSDIDHLGNRRVRAVGELVENQFRAGLVRVEKMIRERMTIIDMKNAIPANLINPKPLVAAIKEFFGSSQLSQFMDQVNPLAELTHKRRISALGPGGLNRERAGFEVRDVHYTHYGRLCPIETPEGQNIGLITSLATYASVNEYGFIETPYRRVKNGKLTGEIEYLTADREDDFKIGPADVVTDDKGLITQDLVLVRTQGDFPMVPPQEVDYIDVSPKQVVSVAASLIPFLEHDDANRALMGSNMQRQAVPLLVTDAPIVGTGMEHKAAVDSGRAITAINSGVVAYVDAEVIIVATDREGKNLREKLDIYKMKKFKRTNQDTTINEKPRVKKGDKIKKGQVIADGPSMDKGEMALGKNVVIAFMPWNGYNYEDAIVLSENLLKKDTFTSVHIEEYEVEARDTKLGPEEITRDIPNVSEETLKNLDEEGIVRTGAKVKPGDILVGKVTPISGSNLTPEEKLLKAIFGSKADNVKDTSLRVPPGIEGIITDIKVFARKERGKKKGKEEENISKVKKEKDKTIAELEKQLKDNVKEIEGNKDYNKDEKAKLIEFEEIYCDYMRNKLEEEFRLLKNNKGDDLPPGVIKIVKVLIAKKRKISVGDKISGRHGNKGVISRILPVEDMPYLADGTPVDVVLNPLGVPSRMNVGQLLETQLGWAGKKEGVKFQTPVFNGMQEAEVKEWMKKVGMADSGKSTLYDGKTGKSFAQAVTVGVMYMMKLVHMVDDKIHARSIGPYSLITQQPLGGKAQFGGQRFGEMEVWALEAYGAAYTLQEMLTVKSDDVEGRKRLYEAIVRGKNIPEPGIPESFNVLVKELQGLALNVELVSRKSAKKQ
ncbi:MAG: DNA-directed RNA polymerase subunit beta [Candidatus Goldiibacteriota bacterium HGW-Goldbacteria-1]|jgi:DNA-directed RNA polymerase subunit beta|nr:MAG: DNA-directed RNA polymerase subunit beta [Candidatus Goldiibacteriota bacterium HGW-Goldbacteria-1]